MKKMALIVGILTTGFSLAACSASETYEREAPHVEEERSGESNPEREETDLAIPLPIELEIGDEVFLASLDDNQTTQALVELFPLSIDMEDLHGNEKFTYLADKLPTNSEKPGVIKAGDIMLYGDNCLVLFYEEFSTSHHYTGLGTIEDIERFRQAAGNGAVRVSFELAQNKE